MEFKRGPGRRQGPRCQHSYKKHKSYFECTQCEWFSQGYCRGCLDLKRLYAEGAKHMLSHGPVDKDKEMEICKTRHQAIKESMGPLEIQIKEAQAIAREKHVIMCLLEKKHLEKKKLLENIQHDLKMLERLK